MIDVYEMLRIKEDEILRVRKEIQALRFIAPMLADPDDPQVLQPESDSATATFAIESNIAGENQSQDETSPEPVELSQGIPPKRSRLRDLLGLAAGE